MRTSSNIILATGKGKNLRQKWFRKRGAQSWESAGHGRYSEGQAKAPPGGPAPCLTWPTFARFFDLLPSREKRQEGTSAYLDASLSVCSLFVIAKVPLASGIYCSVSEKPYGGSDRGLHNQGPRPKYTGHGQRAQSEYSKQRQEEAAQFKARPRLSPKVSEVPHNTFQTPPLARVG